MSDSSETQRENSDTWHFLREDVAIVSGQDGGDYAALKALVDEELPVMQTKNGSAAQTAYINALILRYQHLYVKRIKFLMEKREMLHAMSSQSKEKVWSWLKNIRQWYKSGDEHAYEKIGALLEKIEAAITPALRNVLGRADPTAPEVKQEVMRLVYWYRSKERED